MPKTNSFNSQFSLNTTETKSFFIFVLFSLYVNLTYHTNYDFIESKTAGIKEIKLPLKY